MKLSVSNRHSGLSGGKWTGFALVAMGVFMSTLDSSIVNVALPAIMQDLGVSLQTIEWVVVMYLLTVSSLLLSFGRLSDIKGRRWVYCRGFFMFSLASLICALTENAGWLIAARSLQGIGAAMLMACSQALVVDLFPAPQRGKALGMIGMVVASGLTTGPALGGFLIKTFSWRSIFWINIPIGLAATVLAWFILKGGPGDVARKESFDWSGAVVLVVCLCTFFLALVKALDWGFVSIMTDGLIVISVLCAIWLFVMERRKEHPVFDMSLLKVRLFIFPVFSAVIIFSSLFTIVFLMPFFLVNPVGMPIDRAGYTMAIPFVFLFFVSPVSGAFSDKIGSRGLCTLGMIIMAVSLFFMSRLQASDSFISIAWPMALAGIGTSVFLPPNSNVTMSAVPLDRRGIASATVATARNIGMVIGVAVAGLIFNSVFRSLSGGKSLGIYTSDLEPIFMEAFGYAMTAGCIMAGLGVVVTFLRGPDKRLRNI